MSQRNSDSVEASRWKKKFLDVLEDQDTREKSFSNRIKLLRRGLVGVSLAGDGLDSDLDRQLSSLRTTLRSEDSEAGIEVLLEHIEKSVLRLDSRKEHSTWAVRNAISTSIDQLQSLDLSRDLKRTVKQFAKTLNGRVSDAQNHPELIVDFLELLRTVVQELSQSTEQEATQPSAGFWKRLFSNAPDDQSPTDASASVSEIRAELELPSPDNPITAYDPPTPSVTTIVPASANFTSASTTNQIGPTVENAGAYDEAQTETVDDVTAAENISLDRDIAPSEADGEIDLPADTQQETSEPGFSAIATHAEPALLRILENIYVSEQSVALASKIKTKVAQGLNWYEFVAVLEDISAVITSSLGQERSEFQSFLNELNASLEQVHEYVQFTQTQEEANRSSERALDETVRTQVSDIAESVSDAQDVSELKAAVQVQLNTIITSMDGFKTFRDQQDRAQTEQNTLLQERIVSMEQESKVLRQHLAQQERNAMLDSLTELPNRAAYDRRIQKDIEVWQNSRQDGLCLVICDVDHFKGINDNYGHLAGDKVLKILAREISSRIRESDFVARYGGEEFVIIMARTTLSFAEGLMDTVRMAIERCPFHFKEKQVQITMSFGVTDFCSYDTPDMAFDRADKALYRAKEEGRNRICTASVSQEEPNVEP